MCENCGCAVTEAPADAAFRLGHAHAGHSHSGHATLESVAVLEGLLSANDRLAAHNREHFDSHRVLAVNLMSSPGAGKTSLLERTIEALSPRRRIAVIEGDLATENDARRIRAKGVPAVQITTGNACHLDARMIHEALHDLALEGLDFLFIENVGNLVCPASFALGEHLDVTLLSVPEGDDKPEKYPVMFRASDLLLITKTDLLPLLPEFEPARAEACLRALASAAPVMRLSCRSGAGIDTWCGWLDRELTHHRARLDAERASAASDGRTAANDRIAG
ncbi:MAG: hydrogenase nickel incorporation protein HypB [Steroidobacteraceae bacterium]